MKKGGICSVDEGHAIDVVEVAMFPVSVVDIVFRHCCFGNVEDGGLIHVVPEECVGGGTSEGFVGEEGLPPFDGGWIKAVDPVGGAGPAPAFEEVVVFVFDTEGFGFELGDYRVIGLVLDVRVDDND